MKQNIFETKFVLAAAFFVALTAGACSLLGGGIDANTARINKAADNSTLKGFDPVAYFTDDKPVPGKSEFTTEWNGAKWQFASAANRDAFIADPEKYAPQYGGYCAWAVSKGYTADTDPNAWKIVNGRLYLNYNQDVAKQWNENIPKYVADADQNWREVNLKTN